MKQITQIFLGGESPTLSIRFPPLILKSNLFANKERKRVTWKRKQMLCCRNLSNKEPVLPGNRIRNYQSSLINIVDRPETSILRKHQKCNLMIRIMVIIEKIKKNVRKMNIGLTNPIINTKYILRWLVWLI